MPPEIAAVIERLAYRAWPAQEEATMEGWVLRHSPGLRTRRINSATSPVAHGGDPAEADARIRSWFAARRAQPVVRILSVSDPAIDRHFVGSGWEREAPTLILTDRLGAPRKSSEVRIDDAVEPAWADAKQRLTGMSDAVIATWRRRAADIAGATGYASIVRDGRVVTIGQGVVDGDWLGLFDLNTDPQCRRQGLAEQLVAELESWGRRRGAQGVYLQVEAGNEPARRLYEKRGYGEAYSYWYRRPPP